MPRISGVHSSRKPEVAMATMRSVHAADPNSPRIFRHLLLPLDAGQGDVDRQADHLAHAADLGELPETRSGVSGPADKRQFGSSYLGFSSSESFHPIFGPIILISYARVARTPSSAISKAQADSAGPCATCCSSRSSLRSSLTSLPRSTATPRKRSAVYYHRIKTAGHHTEWV